MASYPLEVKAVRLFQQEDGVNHRTDKYQSKNGICYLRRGQLFHVAVNFPTSFDPRVNRLKLFFYTGPRDKSLESLYTSSLLTVLEPSDTYKWPPPPNEWGAKFNYKNINSLCVEVVSPWWLPVGSWHFEVRTQLVHAPEIQNYVFPYQGTIYFLFNPWNPEDDTHMPDSRQLDQYVLNDVGHVWHTDSRQIWDFGQFEDCVIPAFELLMKRDGLPHWRRGNPVTLSRAIARIVNYNGYNQTGVMIGRWKNDYADGKAPWNWRGSAEILEKYLSSDGYPVKYGQCWVFAGLAVTICRALGLPARLVTAEGSAQDFDDSFTIDSFYNEQLELTKIERLWNYHCWIDAWMKRRDIGKPEYNGWQAVDGTPQRLSDNQYQIGPAPLKAIKIGDVNVPFDTPHMFCDVNGDFARWVIYGDDRRRLIDLDEKRVGQAIFTDDPYSIHKPKRLSIMDLYKEQEGSIQERQAMHRAISSNPHYARRRQELEAHRSSNDVSFEAFRPKSVMFGDDFDLTFKIMNSSNQIRSMQYDLILDVVDHANNVYYSAKVSGRSMIKVNPNESQTRAMHVSSREYAHKLVENCVLRYRVKCWVTETGQPWIYESSFGIVFPNLNIHFLEPLTVAHASYAHLSFDRPVNYNLTNCKLMIGGSCFGRDLPVINLNDVRSGVQFAHRVSVQPVRSGLQKVTVKFTSAEIPKVENWIEVEIRGVNIGRSTRILNFEENMSEIIDNAFVDQTVLS